MARKPNYAYERRQRELGKAAKKEAKREAQRVAVEERRRTGGEEGEVPESAEVDVGAEGSPDPASGG